MDFYNEIKNKTKEEVKEITRKYIEKLEKEHEDDEENIIGYKLDFNPEFRDIEVNGNQKEFCIESRCYYHGYMNKKTKIVYGLKYNYNGEISNDGDYYYLEDDSYIYEFCDYIKDQEVEDEYDLMYYILEFLLRYFKTIRTIDRGEMYRPIYKDEYSYFPPIRKHLLTDFKGKGNALCSEYAVMAQNLMSIFGISSAIVIGAETIDGGNLEQHAYNFVELTNEETKEKKTYVADFLNYVRAYDINFDMVDMMPFLGEIEPLTDAFLEKFIFGKEQLDFEDYGFMYIGDTVSKLGYDRKRTYYIDNVIGAQKVLTKKNKQKD